MKKLLDMLGFTKETLMRFILIAVGSQFIYSINALRSVLFDPFRDTLGITNTQLGALYSIVAIAGMCAYVPGTWITDRFSSRKIMTVSLILVGISAWVMSSSPAYPILVSIFILWGFIQDGPFWAAVLKSVRCTASDEKQGTAFGFLELIRGGVEFLTNGLAIAIFAYVGHSVFGMQVAMMINGGLIIMTGLLCWFVLEEDNFLKSETNVEKNKEVLKGIKKAILMPEAWLTGLAAGGIYTMYVGIQWFVPFLTNVYAMPIAMAAIFGLFNTSVTRMIASPLGGVIADNKFGSSINFIRVMLLVAIVVLSVILSVPKSESLLYVVMGIMIFVTITCYMLRGVYFAPIGEMKIPKAISGAVMSISAMIAYSPAWWLNTVNGYLLDTYTPEEAYSKIFMIMIAGAIVGFVCASILYRRIKANKLIEETV